MTFFPEVKYWNLPPAAWEASLVEMARDGRRRCEGVALWLGRRESGAATITHVVALRGRRVKRESAFMMIEPELFGEVTDVAMELGVRLLGHVHSHPPRCPVDLSFADRTCGVLVPYYLSVVVPDFALRSGIRIEDSGVHVWERERGFRRLDLTEMAERLRLVGDLPVPVIEVGR